jgi:hypothetical protein
MKGGPPPDGRACREYYNGKIGPEFRNRKEIVYGDYAH